MYDPNDEEYLRDDIEETGTYGPCCNDDFSYEKENEYDSTDYVDYDDHDDRDNYDDDD